MEFLEILIECTLIALFVLTCLTLGTQHNAKAIEKNQEGEQENDHDTEAGLPEGDKPGDVSAPDDQGPAPLILDQATNRHAETTHIESTRELILNLKTEEAGSEVHAKVMKFGSKIGIWATGISVPALIGILDSAHHNRRTNLGHTLLLLASTLAMLASFISGGILLIFPLFHAREPLSIKEIKTIISVALGSMAVGVSFVTGLMLQSAYVE